MDWLTRLAEKLLELLPWVVVHEYERGVRFRRGKVIATLEPGWHWYVPYGGWEEIHLVHISQENVPVGMQTVITQDNHAVTFGTNITFEIVDAAANYTQVTDFITSLSGAAKMHLAKKVREKTLADLVGGQDELERSLRGTLTTRVRDWGVRIVDVGLTDFAPSQAYRFFGDPSPFLH